MRSTSARFCLFLALWGVAANACALSCMPIDERYVVICTSGHCESRLQVAQVSSFGVCGRRDSIARPDAALGTYVASLLTTTDERVPDGIYVLSFSFPHWGHERGTSLDVFLRNLNETLFRGGRIAQLPAPSEMVEKLNRYYGSKWMSRTEDPPTAEGLGQLVSAFESGARLQLIESAALWTVYWASFAALLAALVQSIHEFFARLHARDKKSAGTLRRPIIIQIVVMVLASFGIALSFTMQFWPGLLLAPAIAVIWFAEGWSYYRMRNAT